MINCINYNDLGKYLVWCWLEVSRIRAILVCGQKHLQWKSAFGYKVSLIEKKNPLNMQLNLRLNRSHATGNNLNILEKCNYKVKLKAIKL